MTQKLSSSESSLKQKDNTLKSILLENAELKKQIDNMQQQIAKNHIS